MNIETKLIRLAESVAAGHFYSDDEMTITELYEDLDSEDVAEMADELAVDIYAALKLAIDLSKYERN